jgi:hypothetical protein
MIVVPKEMVIVDSQIDKFKKQGFKMSAKVDGLVMMNGGARNNYGKIVLVPETHPAFNGGMFIDLESILSSKMRYRITKTLSKLVKKTFFSKEKQ